MSCYRCDPYHVGRIAAFMAKRFQYKDAMLRDRFPGVVERLYDPADPTTDRHCLAFAEALAQVNADSVNARYTLHPDEDAAAYILECRAASRKLWDPDETPYGAIWNAIGCFIYQSCEAPGWEDSEVCRLVELARKECGDVMAARQGGRDVWELEEPEDPRKVVRIA